VRSKGEGSIYKRSDGYYVAQLSRRVDGRRQLIRRVRKTQKEARAALKELHRQVEAGVQADAKATVASFANHWLENVAPYSDMRESTVDNYAKLFRCYVTPYIGGIRLTELTPDDVERMLGRLAREGKSTRTRQHARAALVRLLRRAQQQRLVVQNVAEIAEGPKGAERKLDDVLNADEITAVLEVSADHRLGAIASLALTLGMRQGEILGLRWEDVDLDAGTLRVTGTLKRRPGVLQNRPGAGLYREPKPKTKAGRRELPLVNGTLDMLKRRQRIQREERMKAGPLWHDSGYVFTGLRGDPLGAREATRLWYGWTTRAVGRRVRFHASRHSAATYLLAQGVRVEKVQQLLGHANIGITLDTYGHPSVDDLRVALDRTSESS
jgi:integrase